MQVTRIYPYHNYKYFSMLENKAKAYMELHRHLLLLFFIVVVVESLLACDFRWGSLVTGS